MGIDYGPGHRGIEALYAGQDQVLAKLSLPSSVADTKEQYTLHPSIMDGALQAAIGLSMDEEDKLSDAPVVFKPILPFGLNELEIFDTCPSSAWAAISYSNGHNSGDKAQNLDIDLCDEKGNLCMRIKGLLFPWQRESMISMPSLASENDSYQIIPNISDKPSGIVLPELSEEQLQIKGKAPQICQPITLSKVDALLSDHSMGNEMTSLTYDVSPTESPVVPDNSEPYEPIEFLNQSDHLRSGISLKSLQKELKTSLTEALFMKEGDIDSDKQFVDMAMDSIVGVEWIRAINNQYGITITATKIYDNPNMREFSEYLKKELNLQRKSFKKTLLKSNASLSLDKIMLQVEHGNIDIEQADQLFNEINL